MTDLEGMLREGIALHQQGKLVDAERVYQEVLSQQPDHFDALHMLGVIAVQTGRIERGVELISQAIRLNGTVASAHSNLGAGLRCLNRFEEAVASYDKAITLKPDYAEAYLSRADALRDLNRSADAVASYDRAIALNPDCAEAYGGRGDVLFQLGRHAEAVASYDHAIALRTDYAEAFCNRGTALAALNRLAEAVASYDRAVTLKPDHAVAYSNRGNVLQDLDHHAEAIASYDRAIRLRPDYAEAYNNRGNALRILQRHAEAIASYDHATALQPDYAEAYSARGCALRDVGCPDEAIASHDRAIALRPGYAEAYNERGHALHDLNRHAEALVSYDHAIALKPDYAEAYSNRGVALRSLKRHEEAVASQERAIALKSDYAEAYWNQSLCLLQMGRFELGWRRYEWRKRKAEWRAIFVNPQPLWLGEEDIAGKTIFLHYEQGFGDTILSCRYAKLVEARGANVIMEVQPRLHKLLKQISPTIQVTTPDNRPAAYDYHCPLMSLPLAFRTTLATIPSEPRYLQADAASRAIWSARLPARKKSRIGMVWSGSSNYTADRTRSIELATLLPLFGVDADWVCLQKELNHNDADVLRAGGIAFYGDEQNDFSDAAALIDQMDLVIAVDTAVAHLAAAMGKPTWILLSYNPDWRWLLDRDDSPWYPGVKLFRQRRPGDWTGVIDQIIARLNFSFRAN